MSRDIKLESGRLLVSDDPEDVIGMVLDIAVNNRDRWHLAERFAPDGDGVHIDRVGSVSRAEPRDDLPDPSDPSLDPETTELWVLYRDFCDDEEDYRRYCVLTGDELRELVARAAAIRDEYSRG